MRILLWAPHGSGEHYWGPGISAYNLYNSKTGFESFSLYLAHGFKEQKRYELFQDQFYIGNINQLGFIGTLIFLIQAKLWIKRNAHKFDIVHVLGAHHISFLPAIWFQKKGIKTVIKMPNANSGFSNNSKFSNILGLSSFRKRNAPSITGYISISSAITDELKAVGIPNDKIFQIPNGVNVEKFKPVSSDGKWIIRQNLNLKNLFTIVIVGEVCKRKGQKFVVDAFLSLPNSSKMQLLIIGPPGKVDDQTDEIREVINDNYANIHLIGFSNDMVKYYQASDIFILPSENEGLSNSMLEALATGLPAIVTKISGSEDVITHYQNGIFVGRDKLDIKNAIEYYFSNPDKLHTNSRNARELIVSKYNACNILQKHIDVFREHIL